MSTSASEQKRIGIFGKLRRHWVRWSIATFVAIFIAAELFSRFYLGLGDPPLSMTDAKMEYLFKPGDYHRFGNHIFFNQYSMRSGPVTEHKTDPAELRVLMVGDSVINGGSLTDDSQLATSILQERLHAALHRPVFVGNISAGSWGPPNELAYLEKFGLFDADALVIVVSSHDYADAPDFKPVVDVNPAYPSHRPVLAVQELVMRYLLPRILHTQDPPDPGTVALKTPDKKDIEWCLESLRQMIRLAREHGMAVIVAQHWQRNEIEPGVPAATGQIAQADAARDEHVEPVELGPAFKQDVDAGHNPYRDVIHPNAEGQKLIADTLYPILLEQLSNRTKNTTVPTTFAATRPAN
ncbi:MAG TPA: GDSL-type esterase/lipase family protein [Tepidisphaeraceae bacterium]|jgi:hypothetical protein|nr:GDSL-type esterase/lipase family protein [Tepidisphaeraceae bacterium]